MSSRVDRTKLAVLKALHDIGETAGASRITERLSSYGLGLQPRTIRLYLSQLDGEGMTEFVSRRRGRRLTARGEEELARADVLRKVGFVAARVDGLAYQMSFNRRTGAGQIITNVAMVDRRGLAMAVREIEPVFRRGLGMGQRMALVQAGGKIGGMVVPDGMVGIGTVCSVTLNGVLLHEGIPVLSRFGGLVEMRDGEAVRFVEIIEYAGTTIDPLEAFISADMTRVRECVQTGSGIIGASFREFPSAAIEDFVRVRRAMAAQGLEGVLAIGKPGRPLLDIPVGEGRTGVIVLGGLNPVAAVHEAGVRLAMQSLAGLEDVQSFTDYREVCGRHA